MIFSRTMLLMMVLGWAHLCLAQANEGPSLRTRWRFSTPAATEAAVGADDGTAGVGDRQGNVCVISTSDGKQQWTAKLPAAATSGLAFSDGMLFIGDEEGTLHALAAEGKELWTAKTGGKIVGRPLVAGKRVIVGSYDNSVHCLELKTGKELWSFATQAQVHAGVVHVGEILVTGGCDGHLRAIGPNGKEKWSVDLEGAIATTPAVADGKVYVGTMSGGLAAVDENGQVAWKVTPLKEAAVFTTSPAVMNGRVVYVSDDGQVVSLKSGDGGEVVTGRVQGKPGTNMLAYGGVALVGTGDGKIEVIDPATAKTVRHITLGGSVRALAIAGQMVIASTDEGAVWGLAAAEK